MTMRAAVTGNPVGHSLSPAIHGAWIAAAGLDATYEAVLAEDEAAFRRLVEAHGGLRGLNVTIPWKEAALGMADEASDLARLAGAANLLVFDGGKVRADNTDGPGLLAALKIQAGYDPRTGPAVILGAGGAAKGAAAALKLAGAPQVRIVNRTHARAEELAAHLGVEAVPDPGQALDGAALVVNATSLGLGGGQGPDVPLERAPGAVVMDMVYKPLRTAFLERAAALGHPTVDGLEMLIRQAEPSFEAFFGRPPPQIDVRSLVLSKLGTKA